MYSEDEKTEAMREKLRDYYGTAMALGMPMAVIDLAKVDRMSDGELEKEIKKNHIR